MKKNHQRECLKMFKDIHSCSEVFDIGGTVWARLHCPNWQEHWNILKRNSSVYFTLSILQNHSGTLDLELEFS